MFPIYAVNILLLSHLFLSSPDLLILFRLVPQTCLFDLFTMDFSTRTLEWAKCSIRFETISTSNCHAQGFEPEPCEVRFGDVPAVTMVPRVGGWCCGWFLKGFIGSQRLVSFLYPFSTHKGKEEKSSPRCWFYTCFYFHPYLGKWSNFDEHIFQMRWNHQHLSLGANLLDLGTVRGQNLRGLKLKVWKSFSFMNLDSCGVSDVEFAVFASWIMFQFHVCWIKGRRYMEHVCFSILFVCFEPISLAY